MPKPPADPIRDANREWWRKVKSDASYRAWMIERYRQLIEVCEWPDRAKELHGVLEEIERIENGTE